ncbi:hypothetical protein SAMN04489722_10234 [Algibacter lectus]|nr:hypothetical protein SAMN04489722_10234 [Algibacter lectus]
MLFILVLFFISVNKILHSKISIDTIIKAFTSLSLYISQLK